MIKFCEGTILVPTVMSILLQREVLGSIKKVQRTSITNINLRSSEGSFTVSDLLGAFSTIRPRADQHHALIEGTPQWGGRLFVPKGAQHDQHPINQAVAKLETVPEAQ